MLYPVLRRAAGNPAKGVVNATQGGIIVEPVGPLTDNLLSQLASTWLGSRR